MEKLGWKYVDVVVITGDAYVDHPSFGAAIIARVLEKAGFRVGVIPQPDISRPDSMQSLGRPRLMFAVTAGNVDSMVNLYNPSKVPRRKDDYSPGGEPGRRPRRATIAYTAAARAAFKGVPVVIGGVEASLRRLAHYDYWDDKVRRSILVDAKADILVYGMGERPIVEIAIRLAEGEDVREIKDVLQTVARVESVPEKCVELPSFEETSKSENAFARAFAKWYKNPGGCFVQRHGDTSLLHNASCPAPSKSELDAIYDLPITRRPHPMYDRGPAIPAFEMIKDSITSHRGCAGGCAFCAISAHQGKTVSSRSRESVLGEASRMAADEGFSGTVTDVGGPTANMYAATCDRGGCDRPSCLYPKLCEHFHSRQNRYFELLRAVRKLPGINHVFVGSGIRHDLFRGRDAKYIEELVKNYVGGHLKVAPEHVSAGALRTMRKPPIGDYERFAGEFNRAKKSAGKKLYLVPYFITGHPGTTMEDQVALAEYIKKMPHNPEQMQDFMPAPMTLAGAMYYLGCDPVTGKEVHVPRGSEKNEQRALAQFFQPRNRRRVIRALERAGRTDLVGTRPECLIGPEKRKKKKRR